ncbi:sulfate adenylyltransferase subunit 1 [Tessaracoccus defluvii]|uniref:sulfate adenylyltransferase n=1 Tax=Tessaracoccus defluvii TaxID=1285901 RepID=A0A7H0H6A5_9ACTN|nr:GTP-binding protein [Tessaracoccus defluvii]QNP56071.1 50S ribosome-binding GTPase [Tessaracoccus defluvii]
MSRGLLRFATAGSVDDGKSTLIGRLLYDSKGIFVDQYEAVERVSRLRGDDYVDLALLTDGLRAEREQGITIDVAYRYFATPRRKFIIADTPGHPQYTRNMVTGASTADAALILIDVRHGMTEQSRRHAFLTTLLGVRHLVVCVNKMDLVDYSEAAYQAVVSEFTAFATRLNVPDLTFIPISALMGDNVTRHSEHLGWYDGPTLLYHLENLHVSSDRNLVDVRFPVQYVIRPQQSKVRDYRGYAGAVASGVIKVGDDIMVLPSGFTTTVEGIDGPSGPLKKAYPPMSVVLRLSDELDISRGDVLVRPENPTEQIQDLDLRVCWMDETTRLTPGRTLAVKHTTAWARVKIKEVLYRVDINTLHRVEGVDSLGLNDIGRVRMRCTRPLMMDRYQRNRETGSVILVDEATNKTVGAGFLS